MFGYASDETETLMPLTHMLATSLGSAVGGLPPGAGSLASQLSMSSEVFFWRDEVKDMHCSPGTLHSKKPDAIRSVSRGRRAAQAEGDVDGEGVQGTLGEAEAAR